MQNINQGELLCKINSPDDVKALAEKDLDTLCHELRDYIIGILSSNPGHLASSLGTVELTEEEKPLRTFANSMVRAVFLV